MKTLAICFAILSAPFAFVFGMILLALALAAIAPRDDRPEYQKSIERETKAAQKEMRGGA